MAPLPPPVPLIEAPRDVLMPPESPRLPPATVMAVVALSAPLEATLRMPLLICVGPL